MINKQYLRYFTALLSLTFITTFTHADTVSALRPIFKMRSDLQCWPTQPNSGSNSGECLSQSEFESDKPNAYIENYAETVNGKAHRLITYWLYYGNQNGCASADSGHDDDWEAVTVHTVDGVMAHVTYGQHNGRYTLAASDTPTDNGHPIAFVGKYSHGNYHDERSRASWDSWAYNTGDYCYYWKDPRGPGSSFAPGGIALSNVGTASNFPGSTNPINRSTKPYQQSV
jgi:hypothetical protein